jgi:hypothetical protein
VAVDQIRASAGAVRRVGFGDRHCSGAERRRILFGSTRPGSTFAELYRQLAELGCPITPGKIRPVGSVLGGADYTVEEIAQLLRFYEAQPRHTAGW